MEERNPDLELLFQDLQVDLSVVGNQDEVLLDESKVGFLSYDGSLASFIEDFKADLSFHEKEEQSTKQEKPVQDIDRSQKGAKVFDAEIQKDPTASTRNARTISAHSFDVTQDISTALNRTKPRPANKVTVVFPKSPPLSQPSSANGMVVEAPSLSKPPSTNDEDLREVQGLLRSMFGSSKSPGPPAHNKGRTSPTDPRHGLGPDSAALPRSVAAEGAAPAPPRRPGPFPGPGDRRPEEEERRPRPGGRGPPGEPPRRRWRGGGAQGGEGGAEEGPGAWLDQALGLAAGRPGRADRGNRAEGGAQHPRALLQELFGGGGGGGGGGAGGGEEEEEEWGGGGGGGGWRPVRLIAHRGEVKGGDGEMKNEHRGQLLNYESNTLQKKEEEKNSNGTFLKNTATSVLLTQDFESKMRASLHQISNGVLSNAPVNILHKQPPFQEKDRLSVSSRQPSTAAETQRKSSYRTGSGPTIWSGGEQNIDVPLHFIASQRHQPPSVSPQVRSSWATHQHSTPFHHTKEELKPPADRREVFINHVEKLESICQMSIKARAMKQWESRAFEHLVKRRVFSVWFYSQRGELLMKKMWPVVQKQLLQKAMAHLIIHGKIHGFREQWRARRRRRALARWARRAARAGRAGRSRGPRRRRRRLGRALRRWARAGRLARGRRLAVEYYTKRRFFLALQKMKLLLLLRIKLSRFCTQKDAVEQKKTMSTLQRHAATRVMGQIRIARGKTHGTMRLTARGLKALSWHWKTKAHQDIFTMKAAVFQNEFAKRTVLHHLYRECQYAKKKRSNKVTHFASVRLILLRRAFSVMFMHHSHSSMDQRYLMQGAAKHHSLTAQFKYLRLWARPAQRRRQRRRRPRGAASDEGGPPPPPPAAGARRALRRLRAAAHARAAGAAAGRFLEQKTKHITLAWLWQHTLLQRQLKKARLIANLRCVKSFFRRMKEGFHRNLLDAEAKQVATLKLLERFLCRMQKSASRTKHQILVYQEASEHFSFGWKRRALRRLAARPRLRRAAGRRRRRLLGRPFRAWRAAARNCILGGLQEREKRLYEVKIYFSRLRKRTMGSIHLRKCVLMGQRRRALGCWANYTMKQSRQRTISQKAFRAWCVLNASKHMKKWQTFCKIKQKQRILLYRLQCHRLLRRLKQRVRSVQSQKVVVWRASVYSSQKSVSVCLRFWSTMVKQQVQLQDKIQILQTRQKRKSSIQSSLHQQISSSVHYNVATQLSQKTYFNSKDNAIITMDSSVAQLHLDHWKAFTYMSKQLAAMISALSRHRSAIGLRYAFLQWWFSATSASNQWGKVLDELKQQPINSMRAKRFYHSLISRRAFNQWKKSRRGIAGTGGGTSSTAKRRKNSSSAKTARQGKGGPLPPKSTQPQGPSLHRAEEAAAGGPTTAECQRLGGGGGGGWRVALGAQQTLLPGSAAGKTSLAATASITNGDPQTRLRRVGLMSEIVNDPPVSTTRLQPTKNIANKEAQYCSPVGEAVQPQSTAPPPKRLNFQPVPLATKENASVLETVDEETDDHGSTEGIGTRCDRPDALAQVTVAPPDLDLLTDKQQNSRCSASGSVVKENNERYLIENSDVVIRLENVLNDEQRVVEKEKYIDKINVSAGAKVKRLDDESSIANFDVKRNESSLLSAVSGLSNIMFPGHGIADVTAIGIGECAIIEEKEHQTSSLLLQTPSTHANNVNLSPPAKSLQTAGRSTFLTHGYSSRPPPRPPQASTSLLHDPEAPPSYLFNFLKKKNSNRVKKLS